MTRHFFNFISWHFHGNFVSRDLRLFILSALLIVNFYGLAIAANNKSSKVTTDIRSEKTRKNTVEIEKLKWPGRRASGWFRTAYKNNLAGNKNAENGLELNFCAARNVSN